MKKLSFLVFLGIFFFTISSNSNSHYLPKKHGICFKGATPPKKQAVNLVEEKEFALKKQNRESQNSRSRSKSLCVEIDIDIDNFHFPSLEESRTLTLTPNNTQHTQIDHAWVIERMEHHRKVGTGFFIAQRYKKYRETAEETTSRTPSPNKWSRTSTPQTPHFNFEEFPALTRRPSSVIEKK